MAERIEMTPEADGGRSPSAHGGGHAAADTATGTRSAASEAARAPDGAASSRTKPRAGKKPKRTWRDTRWGRTLELLAYLVMLVLALVYFTGKGLFIYEGF